MTQKRAKFPLFAQPLELSHNRRVVDLASNQNVLVYLVGGYVRDAMIASYKGISDGLSKCDLDYAIAGGAAYPFAQSLAKQFGGHFVPLDAANDTARVVFSDGAILDFAGCVGGNIETDIRRRDFSINALYWDPHEPDVVNDNVGGLKDIADGVVRAIAESAFVEDPLRALRAYRFACSLGFTIEPKTEVWIANHQTKLNNVACERVNYELFTTFGRGRLGPLLLNMAKSGVLETIFPELAKTRDVTSNIFHHLGLFEHSLDAVLQAERELADNRDLSVLNADAELSHGVTRLAATKIALLLHDIGKPQTWVITPEGKHTFISHERLGADMTAAIGERQKWSRPVSRFISKLVKWHLRPGQLFHSGEPSEKSIYRFYRQAGSDLPELILLALGDLGATRGPAMLGGKNEGLRKQLLELLKGFDVFNMENLSLPKLLNGEDVMLLLDLKPGPIIGQLLKALEEAQEIKEIANRAEAEHFVRQLYNQIR